MAYSPTKIDTYLTCPRQYQAKYITKEVIFQPTPHTVFGDEVHKAIDVYFKTGLIHDYLRPIESILAKCRQLQLGSETKFACTSKVTPTTFFAKNAHLHCIIDVLLANQDQSIILAIDWKTGKKRPATTQRDVIRTCLQASFPNTKEIHTLFVYLMTGEVDYATYAIDDRTALMDLNNKIANIVQSDKTGNYPTNPSGLCKQWCDVVSCPLNGRHDGGKKKILEVAKETSYTNQDNIDNEVTMSNEVILKDVPVQLLLAFTHTIASKRDVRFYLQYINIIYDEKAGCNRIQSTDGVTALTAYLPKHKVKEFTDVSISASDIKQYLKHHTGNVDLVLKDGKVTIDNVSLDNQMEINSHRYPDITKINTQEYSGKLSDYIVPTFDIQVLNSLMKIKKQLNLPTYFTWGKLYNQHSPHKHSFEWQKEYKFEFYICPIRN